MAMLCKLLSLLGCTPAYWVDVVTFPSEQILSPLKAKKIKLAVGGACELCGREYPLRNLEVHHITGKKENVRSGDLPSRILVLCPGCHYDIHAYGCSPAEQRRLIRDRPGPVREQIKEILAYNPPPYTPPEVDLERVFYEAIQMDMTYRVA